MGNSQQLFQSLFKKDLSANDTKDFLVQLTKEHPYFTAAHFFLLKQKASTGANFEKEAAITSLLFNNSLWLNFQLDHTFTEESARYPTFKSSVTDELILKEVVNKLPANTIYAEESVESVMKENIPVITHVEPAIEKVEVNTTSAEDESNAHILSEENIPAVKEVEPAIEKVKVNTTSLEEESNAYNSSKQENIPAETEVEPAIEEVEENTTSSEEESNAHNLSEENIPAVKEVEPIIEEVEENKTYTEEKSSALISSEEENKPTITEVEPAIEEVEINKISAKEESSAHILSEEQNIPAAPERYNEELHDATKFVKDENSTFTLPKFIFNKDEEDGTNNFTEEDFENDVEDAEIEPMNIKLNFTNINTTEDTIAFEPLHVSDYFTSVGIKLTDEVKPGDKLGKQLKSFTQWLKTMKKVHIEQLQEETAENNDLIIQQMAEKSNKEGETLTEAMAEVLTQQGKIEKAIEVYQKLSLLNPVKSAYFAAKIDQIYR